MLYIAEREARGITLPIEQIVVNTVKGRHKEPEHLARNPFGTVPAFELDDGGFILESLAIIHYLEDKFPKAPLCQAAPKTKHWHGISSALLMCAWPARWVHLVTPLTHHWVVRQNLNGLPSSKRACRDPSTTWKTFVRWPRLPDGDSVSIADMTFQASLQFVRLLKPTSWETARYYEPRRPDFGRLAAQAVLKW